MEPTTVPPSKSDLGNPANWKALTSKHAIETISYESMWKATIHYDKRVLTLRLGGDVFSLSPKTFGLPEFAVFHNGNVANKRNRVISMFTKAMWFQGAFPSMGRSPRPPMPSFEAMSKAFPFNEFPSKEDSYIEILNAIKNMNKLLDERRGILPNAGYFGDILKGLIEFWPKFREGALKRAYHILSAISLSVRTDGIEIKEVARFTTFRGFKFPNTEQFKIMMLSSVSWKNIVEGHKAPIDLDKVKPPPKSVVTEDDRESVSSDEHLEPKTPSSFKASFTNAYDAAFDRLGDLIKDKFIYALAIGFCSIGMRDKTKTEKEVADLAVAEVGAFKAKMDIKNSINRELESELAVCKSDRKALINENGELESTIKNLESRLRTSSEINRGLRKTNNDILEQIEFEKPKSHWHFCPICFIKWLWSFLPKFRKSDV
jgi:hypothetical protein